jgi:ethanolamine utilization protein EutA
MPSVTLADDLDAQQIARAIIDHRKAFELADVTKDFALAFRWRGAPEYVRLRALADGIVGGLQDRIGAQAPLYIMLEGDAALTLGHILKDEIKVSSPVLVIDGLTLRDFDFVDIGRIRLPSNMVPVTIKSLLFDVAQKTD